LTVDRLYDFFYTFKVDQIAELREEILLRETKSEYAKEKMDACTKSFFETASRLLTEAHYFSQNTGSVVLEWLDLVDQLLASTGELVERAFTSLTSKDMNITRAERFSAYALKQIIELSRKKLRKKRVALSNRFSLASDIRESTIVLLTNAFYHILKILLTSINVRNEQEEPEQILSVASDALYKLKYL